MTTDTPAAAPTAEREAFDAWWMKNYNIQNHLARAAAWIAWSTRAALSAPVAAQPAASGVDALWVETANDLADKAIAAEREFTEAEVEALCSTIRSDLNLKAGRAREALRTHLSTALTGAATTNTKE